METTKILVSDWVAKYYEYAADTMEAFCRRIERERTDTIEMGYEIDVKEGEPIQYTFNVQDNTAVIANKNYLITDIMCAQSNNIPIFVFFDYYEEKEIKETYGQEMEYILYFFWAFKRATEKETYKILK